LEKKFSEMSLGGSVVGLGKGWEEGSESITASEMGSVGSGEIKHLGSPLLQKIMMERH